MRRTLSVRLSVCLSVRPVLVYIRTVLRAHIQNRKTSVFDYRPASTLRTCGIFCFVYICGPHTVGRSAAQVCFLYNISCFNKFIETDMPTEISWNEKSSFSSSACLDNVALDISLVGRDLQSIVRDFSISFAKSTLWYRCLNVIYAERRAPSDCALELYRRLLKSSVQEN